MRRNIRGLSRPLCLLAIWTVFAAVCCHAQAMPPAGPDWILEHIDVETTGLIPGVHEIVDIGIVYTDQDGTILDRWHRRVMPLHTERVEPAAARINGFDPKVWQAEKALQPKEAVQELLRFERARFPGKKLLRVAFNSKFDAAFMDNLFRTAGEKFDQPNYSFYWLDIPSMAWMLGYRTLTDDELVKKLGVKGKTYVPLEHTGLGCAEFNVRVYRALVELSKRGTAATAGQ